MEQLQHFWDSYTGLFSDPDNKVKLAALTATIAAITFLLTFLIKPFRQFLFGLFKRNKISVKAGMTHTFIQTVIGGGVGTPHLTCTVTNRNTTPVFIHNPTVNLSRSVDGHNNFAVPQPRGHFPMRLEPGQQTTLEYNTADLYNQLLADFPDNTKVSFVVMTTTGANSTSNKVSKRQIVNHINATRQTNR